MELYNDQIHVPGFLKSCTHIWSDDVSRRDKSGVWEYFKGISEQFNLPLVDHTCLPESGVIFVGMCHILEQIFNSMPKSGNYIFVHRTNDRPFTAAMYASKPVSVRHIYTVDCQVNSPNVSAIPFGNASINGEDNLVKQIAQEPKRKADKRLFVCYNTNPNTPQRNTSIPILKTKDFAFVYELDYPKVQMAGDEFYRNVHAHEFTMALAGCGADASRQWAAIQLGSIPIVTDCPEMRHFEDMPLVFCPENMNDITGEWLDEQSDILENKMFEGTVSTDRMRMSYWANHIKEKRKEYGIN